MRVRAGGRILVFGRSVFGSRKPPVRTSASDDRRRTRLEHPPRGKFDVYRMLDQQISQMHSSCGKVPGSLLSSELRAEPILPDPRLDTSSAPIAPPTSPSPAPSRESGNGTPDETAQLQLLDLSRAIGRANARDRGAKARRLADTDEASESTESYFIAQMQRGQLSSEKISAVKATVMTSDLPIEVPDVDHARPFLSENPRFFSRLNERVSFGPVKPSALSSCGIERL